MAQIGPLRGGVQFRLHPHLACRLPYRFPRGRFTRVLRVCVFLPWLLYRFPHGRFARGNGGSERWLPADFPAVGCERRDVLDPSRPARDYALSAMAVEW